MGNRCVAKTKTEKEKQEEKLRNTLLACSLGCGVLGGGGSAQLALVPRDMAMESAVRPYLAVYTINVSIQSPVVTWKQP
jgi:hypothetical protein